MPKQIQLKTAKNTNSPTAYISSLPLEAQKDARALLKLFKEITAAKPKMWGGSIIGFGEYVYHRSTGDEGTFLACGFSMRASGPTLYIMPGYQDYSALLAKLGPHKLGKSCLYLKRLAEVDTKIISKLIKTGIKDLKRDYQVTM